MILTRVHPGPPESFALDAAGTRERLLELYRPPEKDWLRLNFVTSVSGSAAGSDGTSDSITSTTDRRILGVIRELSDVVLVGAASVRTEGYRLPSQSRLAVVTASGDLSGHRIDNDSSNPPLIITPEGSAVRVRATMGHAEIVTVPTVDDRIDMSLLVGALRERGLRSIVCEGGPGLAAQLVAAGLVDELCLTTTPLLTDVSLAVLGADRFPQKRLGLTQLIVDAESSVFARWTVSGH